MNKKILSLTLIMLFLLVPSRAFLATDGNVYTIHKIYTANLDQAGSLASPYEVDVPYQNFTHVSKFILDVSFSTVSFNIEQFGGDAALTNGLYVTYANQSLIFNTVIDNFTTNSDLHSWSDSYDMISDQHSPVDYQIKAIFTFPEGLDITPTKTLSFFVQDNITALTTITAFSVTVHGYQQVVNSYFVFGETFFYQNAINALYLQDLTVGTQYNLFMTATSDQTNATYTKWINTTAEANFLKINLAWNVPNAPLLHLYLYRNNSLLEQKDWFIQQQNLAAGQSLINQVGVFIAVVIIGFIVVGFVFNRKKRY